MQMGSLIAPLYLSNQEYSVCNSRGFDVRLV
nr:MAG TPA: hypothetical protein [Caudoviricetes sp.]